jgi:hypothetical protein
MKVLIKSADTRFRRAGIEFTRDGVEVDTDDLTEEQIQSINDEPRLSNAGEVEADAGDDGAPAAGGKKPKLAKSGKKAGK